MSANPKDYDYVIVGGGCFGASTALALIRRWTDSRIIWLEGAHERTASRDLSKIVRAAYEDQDYVDLAESAMDIWRTDPLLKAHYHHTGWVQVFGKESHANAVVGRHDTVISIERMQEATGSKEQPKLEAGERLRLNENVGYADYDSAVEAVAKEAARLGVRREKKNVTRLIVENGICLGVDGDDFRVMAEKETVVAAGPWTPSLLGRSNVEFRSDFFTVAGVGVATLSLPEEIDSLKSAPMLVGKDGRFGHIDLIILLTDMRLGEIMPSAKHKVLKITSTQSFHVDHPDELEDVKSFDIGNHRALLEKMLPQFAGRHLDWWICPYVPQIPSSCVTLTTKIGIS